MMVHGTEVYETFWQFIVERHNVYLRRISGLRPPWTEDAIIQKNRFTNVYRVLDRVSQYLVRKVIYNRDWNPDDLLFRILLFKVFNRVSTWEALEREVGEISFQHYQVERYSRALEKVDARAPLYSAAYIMPNPGQFGRSRKYQNHLSLVEYMIRDGLTKKVAKCRSLKELFLALGEYRSLGRFLAYQYAIDINYSELTDFSEMEFVVPGPGAERGIRKCFISHSKDDYCDLIRFVAEEQDDEFSSRGLAFQSIEGRPLQLIDMQNVFCEVDKYSRVAYPNLSSQQGRSRIKQRYFPKESLEQPMFPPKWNAGMVSSTGGSF